MQKGKILAWRNDQNTEHVQLEKPQSTSFKKRRFAIQHQPAGQLKQMRAEGFGPAYIKKQIQHKTPMIFGLYGLASNPSSQVAEGRILRGYTYILDLLVAKEERLRVEKINLKYMYKVDDRFEIEPNIQTDTSVQQLALGPARQKSERHEIDEEMLVRCFKEKRMMTLVTRAGEVFTGHIDWFSDYEIKIRLDVVRKSVVVFQHTLYRAAVT